MKTSVPKCLDLSNKEKCQELLLSIVRPLIDNSKEAKSLIHIVGRSTTYSSLVRDMESFARPLWGLVPFFLGGGKADDIEQYYLEGIAQGCDKTSIGYWGNCKDSDQRFVEMAPIAFALLALPNKFWSPLTKTQKENVSNWLYQINNHKVPRCNWVFFRIIVNTALKHLGVEYSKENLIEDKIYIESNYISNGWYKDGQTGRKDYYSAFAMQFYSLILYHFEDENREIIKKRAIEFANSFINWFSPTGSAIPYGRSLTYRFGQCAFFAACLFAGIYPFEASVMKGVINRNIKYFLNKEIFSADGILQVGYYYTNHIMAEKYNAPGSPYWALKAFLFLALNDDEVYWKEGEAPLPRLDRISVIKEAEMLIHHQGKDTIMFTPGNYSMNNLGHFREKYFKFCYSTAFPFSVSSEYDTVENSAPDSTLSFYLFNSIIVTKEKCSNFAISNNSIEIEWDVIDLINVKTKIILTEEGHIRRHVIYSKLDCLAYDAGFASNMGSVIETNNSISIESCSFISSIESDNGKPYLIKAAPNTNLLHPNSLIPAIKFEIKKGKTIIETRIRTKSC